MNKGIINKGIEIFREQERPIRTMEAIRLGVHPRTLYAMARSKAITRLARGIFALDGKNFENPDIVIAAVRVPKGVICLISALSFHNITTQIPHEVQIALPRPTKYPKQNSHPPFRFYSFSRECHASGIEEHTISGTKVRVYSPEKTIADCFKFRNKIGLDVAIEALRYCIKRKKLTPRQILRYARICRVEKIMMPYLEACQ